MDALSAFTGHARALEPMDPKNSFSDQRLPDELFREFLCAIVIGLRSLFRRWRCGPVHCKVKRPHNQVILHPH
jgi:hypothetical protein